MNFIIIIGLISSVLGIIGWNIPKIYLYLKRNIVFSTINKHYTQLNDLIKDVPFIYGKEKGNILEDFVNIDFKEIYLGFLYKIGHNYNKKIDVEEMIHLNNQLSCQNRVLFLANAGMGKTTFLSFLALSISKGEKSSYYNDFKKNMIPVFISLKLLNNSSQRPILDYILNKYVYFNGRKGLKRLIKLANNEKLIIILDGYDEFILNSENKIGGIKKDIECLFDSIPNLKPLKGETKQIRQFYKLMKYNKVWLTSRKDYYMDNRLNYEIQDVNILRLPNLLTIELLGLSNKMELVKRIFDRYREKSEFYAKNLNEDVFFNYLYRQSNDDLLALSNNPLFLTTMCYVYINNIGNQNNNEFEVFTVQSLIMTCIRLLIKDIDKEKVRGLPDRVTDAIKEKRGLYFEEKMYFLGYFATLCYRKKQRIFYKEELIIEAKIFFKKFNYIRSNEIIKGLNSDKNNNIIKQLIEQNIFINVENGFDFPHLRFREVLALSYIDNEKNIDEIINNIDEIDYRELIILSFNNSKYYSIKILKAILSKTFKSNKSDYFISLAIDCLKNRTNNSEYADLIFNWIKDILNFDIKIPTVLLSFFVFNNNILNYFIDQIENSLKENNKIKLIFYSNIYYNVNNKHCIDFFIKKLKEKKSNNYVKHIINTIYEIDISIIEKIIADSLNDINHFTFILVKLIKHDKISKNNQFWRKVILNSDGKSRALFFNFFIKNKRVDLVNNIFGMPDNTKLEKIIPYLKKSKKDVYVYSKHRIKPFIIKNSPIKSYHKKEKPTNDVNPILIEFNKTKDGVYFNIDFLNKIIKDLNNKLELQKIIDSEFRWNKLIWNEFVLNIEINND